MLKQLKIENFRCFKCFELNQLGRVNLLVGKNNSGKTSTLEAINLFCSRVDLEAISTILLNRGENDEAISDLDLSLLFYGYNIDFSFPIIIEGNNSNGKQKIIIGIVKIPNIIEKKIRDIDTIRENFNWLTENIDLINNDDQNDSHLLKRTWEKLKKEIDESEANFDEYEKIISKQGFSFDNIKKYNLSKDVENIINLLIEANNTEFKTIIVKSYSLTSNESIELFENVVLTPDEDLVYEALKIIEPTIERIAPIGKEIKNSNSRGGFYVKLSDSEKRIPIGSMGDGVWRMLGLSLALVAAKDGVLLVDEIDTGLHYTALEDMWKLIWETAKKLNIQVFATTHSRDCYEALEVLANRDDVGEEDISIQRIEKDATKSVPYNKEEIAVAAEREIEVR